MTKNQDKFSLSYAELKTQLHNIAPIKYVVNRNFLTGDITRLGPFITHGIISTQDLAAVALNQATAEHQQTLEKFVFQLAWRDFFHRVWQHNGEDIFQYLHKSQLTFGCIRGQMPQAILDANTGISVLDHALQQLYTTGYIHNHARLWLAFAIANLAHTDWIVGAKWMYFHLLDGDLASNTLSWQWVAGTFSKKQYIANQENLNKYSPTHLSQANTFLDVSYEQLAKLVTPEELLARANAELTTPEFEITALEVVINQISAKIGRQKNQIFLRSMFHLDPNWHANEEAYQIVLIEPDCLEEFPISAKRIDFIQHWLGQIQAINASTVVIVKANFKDFAQALPAGVELCYQKHNACQHWHYENAQIEPYPWLFSNLSGDYSSFFSFWKKAKKQLTNSQWQAEMQANCAHTSFNDYAA